MKTTEATANAQVCPVCKDELTEDLSNKGFVRHKTNPNCDHQRGERDAIVSQTAEHQPHVDQHDN